MYKMTYKCDHVVELCQCIYHKKVTISKIDEKEVKSLQEAVKLINYWNGGCFVYKLISLECIIPGLYKKEYF